MGLFGSKIRKRQDDTIIELYLALVEEERWEEALPLIEEIVQRGEHIATSWFNWGVCLSALLREAEAAEKFIRAYELEPDNYEAQCRAFRSLYFAGDHGGFLAFAEQECAKIPEMIEILQGDDDFSALFSRPEFQALKQRFER